LPDVIRLVEGASPPFRAALALAYGAGLEISAILALVETDVDANAKEVRARGTKTWTRDRVACVADWARPHVELHLKTLTPGERLFRGMNRWEAGDMHRERCRALDLVGYRLHDARHHWAVRMVRAGMPLELVARQLGHRDVVMVAKVYGRFVPNTVERDRWEQAAAALDKKKWKDLGTSQGTSASVARKKLDARRPATDGGHGSWENSRGGTRTRDPGIMSAVL
jgi:integrase